MSALLKKCNYKIIIIIIIGTKKKDALTGSNRAAHSSF